MVSLSAVHHFLLHHLYNKLNHYDLDLFLLNFYSLLFYILHLLVHLYIFLYYHFYHFHDYKKAGIEAADLERWSAQVGWEKLLNKAGTTFKKLPDADKADIDGKKAIALMLAQPSVIKRPVVQWADAVTVGFAAEDWLSRI